MMVSYPERVPDHLIVEGAATDSVPAATDNVPPITQLVPAIVITELHPGGDAAATTPRATGPPTTKAPTSTHPAHFADLSGLRSFNMGHPLSLPSEGTRGVCHQDQVSSTGKTMPA
jgi:hypothetical protein